MRTGSAYPSPRTKPAGMDSLDLDDLDVLSHLSKEITDALISYEKVAAPVFGTVTTIQATGSHNATYHEGDTGFDCGISFDTGDDFNLELMSIESAGVLAETTVQIHSAKEDHNSKVRLRQQVSPWTLGTGFDSVRSSFGSMLRRASSSCLSSQSADAALLSINNSNTVLQADLDTKEAGSFRNCTFEPDIVEEPTEDPDESSTHSKPTSTRLGRLAQREATKAARKAEKALRKTASAGNLSDRNRHGEQRPAARALKEFHGLMGPDFVC